MKLNKEQIEALTSKIHSSIFRTITKKNEVIQNLNLEKFKKTKEGKMYFTLKNSETHKHLINTYGKIPANIKLIDIPCRSNVRSEIVLATIECDNLDILIKKIEDKYTK